MAVISELLRSEEDGTISFGDYTLSTKAKLDNFEHQGDLYKVKTCQEITKLERNGAEYDIVIDGADAGRMKTNLGGKLSLSVELGDAPVKVSVQKC